jgi:hypothetical protein
MSERNVDSLEMTDDMERGRSKDLPVYDPDDRPLPVPLLSKNHIEKRTTAQKYLLLGVFCLGVFIDGQSPRHGL